MLEKESLKWSKIGVISSIILGVIAILVDYYVSLPRAPQKTAPPTRTQKLIPIPAPQKTPPPLRFSLDGALEKCWGKLRPSLPPSPAIKLAFFPIDCGGKRTNPKIKKYIAQPFDLESLPFSVLVYGKGIAKDRFSAYSKAIEQAKIQANSAMSTKITKDVKRIILKDYSPRERRVINKNIERTITTIISHSSNLIQEAIPYKDSILYIPSRGLWECHLQIQIPIIEVLPKRAMDMVFQDEKNLSKNAEKLIYAFIHRKYWGILASFYQSLLKRFFQRASLYYEYARLLSEHFNQYRLAFQIMKRGLKIASDFKGVGGKDKFIQLTKTFEKKLYDWNYYRHQIEDVIQAHENRDGKRLKFSKIFPERIHVGKDSQLVFPLFSNKRRYLYFLWFDEISLGFAPQSGRPWQRSFVYSCSPGTVNTKVLFVVIGGDKKWKNAPLKEIYWKKKVDRRDKEEIEKMEKFLDSLAAYLAQNQGVTARVEFEQLGK